MASDFIEELGGSAKVAEELGLPVNVVSNWKKRGIAWPWRARVADLAKRSKVSVPKGFLNPAKETAA